MQEESRKRSGEFKEKNLYISAAKKQKSPPNKNQQRFR